MTNFKSITFPKSRIATIDVCETGKRKHHVTGMFELDVTLSREKIKALNKGRKEKVSFNAWMISVIAGTIKDYEHAASFLKGKRSLIIFNDINVSVIVEKKLNGTKVPIPLIIEKANERSAESISRQISKAKSQTLTESDIVLQKKQNRWEKMYYLFPGYLRRYFWKYLMRHPKLAYKKMGNVAFTSLGITGNVNGWFIPVSVHPICFGLSTVTKKPVVVNGKIEIRDILNMTVLFDHDVIDGAPMARLIRDLSKKIQNGKYL